MAKRLGRLDVTALVGLIGTVIAALISANFLGEFLVKPAIYVEVKENGTLKPQMLVTNDGSQPAHNLSLFILTFPAKIKTITNTLNTTTDVTLVKPTPTPLERGDAVPINGSSRSHLEIFIPLLSPGIGSKVEIETSLESNESVSVSAVYEEGSTVGSDSPSLARQWSIFVGPDVYRALIYSSVATISYAFIILLLRRYRTRIPIQKFVSTLENWRRKLENEPNTPEEIYLFKQKGFERLIFEDPKSIIQKTMTPKDYIIIDDLNSKLENRNKKIEKELEAMRNTSPEIYQYEVKKLNTECLDQIYKALNIEWDNYY